MLDLKSKRNLNFSSSPRSIILSYRAMDVLFPKIGEIIGGSQREESYEKLSKRCEELGLQGMDWYLDTRRYGTVPHSGFGLGFERLVLFVTGMQNIRDVIPFPRYPKNCEY